MKAHVAGILLAAGAGHRLGRPKALVDIGGQPLVTRGITLLRDGGAAPVIVVTGAAAIDLTGVVTVHNPHWQTGMGSSLAVGLATAPDECAAVVVALVDQPLVGAAAVRRLIAAFHDGASVAVGAAGGDGPGRGRRRRPGVPPGAPGPGDPGRVRRHRPPGRYRHQRGPRAHRRPAAGTAAERPALTAAADQAGGLACRPQL
jgi:GTP:adenosylcobinamide-phosphate guanylyltransferase